MCLCFFITKYPKLYWIMMTTIYLLLGIKVQDKLLKHRRNSSTLEGHSLCAELLSKNIYDVPELPFFFLDKDSICHRAIYSLRVRISMISNHSASLLSPWHHLCNTSKTDDTYNLSTSCKPMLYSTDMHLSCAVTYHFFTSSELCKNTKNSKFYIVFIAVLVLNKLPLGNL